MKAAVINKWGGPDVFEITDIEKPVLTEGKIMIKVFASSVNPVDWKQRQGNHKYILGSPFPIVLGYDVCGEVAEVSPEIKSFKKGDIVFGDLDNKYGGALAEYATGSEDCFTLKPENVSVEEAAGATLVSLTALQALRDKAELKVNQKVVINGASGGVGHVAVQVAHNLGANVIAVAGNNNQAFIKKYHPYKTMDYSKEEILRLDEKVDVFFDVVGNYSFFKVKHMLNKGGVYINPHPRPVILIHKIPAFLTGKKVKTLLRKHIKSDLETIAAWIKNNKLNITVDKVFSLDDIKEAHYYSQYKRSGGKTIIQICNNQ